MLGAQTPCAQVEPFAFAVDTYGDRLNVGQPAPSGMLHRMAHSVAKVSCLSTNVTLLSQFTNSYWSGVAASFLFPALGYPLYMAGLDNNGKMIPQIGD